MEDQGFLNRDVASAVVRELGGWSDARDLLLSGQSLVLCEPFCSELRG